MPSIKLRFALRGDHWVSIRQVPSGLACNCICPACRQPLLAKKGQRQQHHFAHYRRADCPGALETALHLYGKSLFKKYRYVTVPSTIVHQVGQVQASQKRHFTEVIPEYRQHRLVLDLWLTKAERQLAIELKVSHTSTKSKLAKLVFHQIPSIEIDLRAAYEYWLAVHPNGDLAAFNKLVLNDCRFSAWLFNPLQHRWEFRLLQEATPRPVQHSQQGNYHHHHVYNCPRQLRYIKSGFRAGQTYARVFQDCLHCPYCQKIEYTKQWVAFRQQAGVPKVVFCRDRQI